MIKTLRLLLGNDIVGGTLAILLFSVGFSSIIFVLSWLVYRDRYGIQFLEYFRFVF